LFLKSDIKAVLFDLDGTLRRSEPEAHEALSNYAASLGAPNSREKFLQAQRWAHEYFAESKSLIEDRKSFGEDENAFWLNYTYRYLKALGCPDHQAKDLAPAVGKYMGEEYNPQDIIYPDACHTLDVIREAGFTLGLVTNRTYPIDEYMRETGLDAKVDFYFTAGEIGHWKPGLEIFIHALERANAEAKQTVYVGDNYYADVVGARRAGIRPVLIDRQGIFPDADCEVLKSLGDLQEMLDSPHESDP
jgi:putative hydrolase of the HAD superfamily